VKVSKGPDQNAEQIEMPNLVGLKEDQARNLLRSKGWDGQFNITAVQPDNPGDKDKVVDQDIHPGTKITNNQAVNVRIATQPPIGGG
jgi:beta-lactam-binding protein with PASTA domain